MENQENIADVVQTVANARAKKKFEPIIELDKTGPYVHITTPEYNSWIYLYMNDERIGTYRLEDGKISIQLSRPLPREYRFRAEVLKTK